MTILNKTCTWCKTKYHARPSWKKRRFCSRACTDKYTRSLRPEAIRRCRHCRKLFRTNPAYIARRKSAGIYCSRQCYYRHMAIPRKGKRDVLGYISMRGVGEQIRQHRWVMEQYLGRKLNSNEHVHHINGIKTDNRLENLTVLTAPEHHRLHGSQIVRSGKNFKCDKCGIEKYYPPSVYKILGKTYRCISCRKRYGFAQGTGPRR